MVTKSFENYLILRNTQLKKELFDIQTNLDQINENLVKIKSSKFYRLWRIYRYIMENGQA